MYSALVVTLVMLLRFVNCSDVVLETKVLVSRRYEDKKIKSWSWSRK